MYKQILMGCLLAPLLMGVILTVACVAMGYVSDQKVSVVRESVCFDYLPGK